jgi:oligopeptide transport system ATP-binding protein
MRARTCPAGYADTVGADGIPALEVRDLHVEFHSRQHHVFAVNGLSYRLGRGETLAIVGESGSGKSAAAHAVMGTLSASSARVTRGEVWLGGQELTRLPERERRRFRGRRMAMIFQDPLAALNPLFTVQNQIGEMFRFHAGASRRSAEAAAVQLMDRVGIPGARRRGRAYPHEFSGGMRQRVMIAMALALEPDVLIADEPTSGLDVTVQAQVMDLLGSVQRERGTSLVLITHDLGVVAEAADRILVMYAGRAVEEGSVGALYRRPAHPYTAGLMTSLPRLDRPEQELRPIPGTPPDMSAPPAGCPFHPRCRFARPVCETDVPALREVAPGRRSACHFAGQVLDGADGG